MGESVNAKDSPPLHLLLSLLSPAPPLLLPSPKLLLLQALNTEHGLKVPTDQPTILKSRLLTARKEDPALSSLKIELSRDKPDEEVWIVKRD